MSFLRRLFGSNEENEREAWYQKIVDRVPNDHSDEWSEEEEHAADEYYCGLCRGYVKMSSGLHPHTK